MDNSCPWSRAFAATVLLAVCGCGGLVKVKGVVTVDGKPVEAGTMVAFSPLGETRPATGVTDKSGAFALTTFEPGDGVMPGEYKVAIINSLNHIPIPRTISPDDPHDPAWVAYRKALEALRNQPPRRGALPLEYSNPGTTPLRWKVPDDGPKAIFHLQSGAAN